MGHVRQSAVAYCGRLRPKEHVLRGLGECGPVPGFALDVRRWRGRVCERFVRRSAAFDRAEVTPTPARSGGFSGDCSPPWRGLRPALLEVAARNGTSSLCRFGLPGGVVASCVTRVLE